MSTLRLALASGTDREAIYRLRHAVYAAEFGQHAIQGEGCLRDTLDAFNEYVVATEDCDGRGLVRTIAEVRDVPAGALVLGAGSSSLMFLALRQWLTRTSRVLVPDPTYGEYAHVLRLGMSRAS